MNSMKNLRMSRKCVLFVFVVNKKCVGFAFFSSATKMRMCWKLTDFHVDYAGNSNKNEKKYCVKTEALSMLLWRFRWSDCRWRKFNTRRCEILLLKKHWIFWMEVSPDRFLPSKIFIIRLPPINAIVPHFPPK